MKFETDNILAARKALKSSLASEARSSSIGVFGIAGRKTGIVLNKPIFQDDDKLDNIDSYWNAAVASPEVKPMTLALDKKPSVKEATLTQPFVAKKSAMVSVTAAAPVPENRRRSSVKSILKSKKSIDSLYEPASDQMDDKADSGEKENFIEQEDSFAFTKKSLGSGSMTATLPSLQEPAKLFSEDDEISFKDSSHVELLVGAENEYQEEGFGALPPSHAHVDPPDAAKSNVSDQQDTRDKSATLHDAEENTDLHEHAIELREHPSPAPESSKPKRAASKRKAKSFDRQLTDLVVESEGESGTRDSRRRRFRPLEFWKNERVVYGRRESAARLHLPAILDVITVPSDESAAESSRRRRETMAGSVLKKRGYKEKEFVTGVVYDIDQGKEVCKTIMISPDQFRPKTVPNYDFKLHTTFSEGNYMSAGVLSFPKESVKPNKNSGKHTLFFTVLSGVFKVTVHQLTFIATTGCQFIVPRGNQYEIRNMATKESRLSYCHCKDLLAENVRAAPSSEPEPESECVSETQATSSSRPSSDDAPSKARKTIRHGRTSRQR